MYRANVPGDLTDSWQVIMQESCATVEAKMSYILNSLMGDYIGIIGGY